MVTHRVTLRRGQATEIAWGGGIGTYLGWSEDLYADGTTATNLSIELFGEPWQPDAGDTALHAFRDHCARIVTVSEGRLELEIGLQPAHRYDPERCHMACCVTEEQRKPAPDGSVECCFCSDEPR